MIYKFNKQKNCLEVERVGENGFLPDGVTFSIINTNESTTQSIKLNKEDVFKLIGALHLLHKEMK